MLGNFRKWHLKQTPNVNILESQRRTHGSEKICGNWNLFKKDEKCFLFHLKSSICSQDI